MYVSHDFIYERSVDYLNWRYCDPRGGRYNVFQARVNNKIVGYIVCRVGINRKGETRGYIVDLLVDPDHLGAAFSLLESGLECIEEYDVNAIIGWVISEHHMEKVFSFFGFLNSRKSVGIFLGNQDIGEDKTIVLNASSDRLHFQMGDTDWI